MEKHRHFPKKELPAPLKRAGLLLLSLLLPAAILYIGVALLGVTPFGNHTLAISDGGGAMAGLPGFGAFMRRPGNLLYSTGGLGGNSWAGWAWGGFHFGKLLSVFATPTNAPEVFTWVCVLNLSLCGLTMYLLLASERGHGLSNLIFSTSYALMGFNVCYCYHGLFFIGPQMLPLMVLGLLKLFRDESPLVYILSLALCVYLNFYFGFMLCVASVIVFLARLGVNWPALKDRAGRLFITYAVSSVIAGLLGAVMWLPALKAYSGGGRLTQAAQGGFAIQDNMPFLQIFSKLFSGANSDMQQVDGLPNIFCGILVVALVILYFMNQRVPRARKRAAGGVIGFYLLTFYISVLTKLMHGGTHTNWFNYRYSFVFSFFLIMIAVEEFAYLDALAPRDIRRCGTALLVSSIVVFSVKYEFIGGAEVLLDFALVALMVLFFRLYRAGLKGFTRPAFTALLLIVVSVNLLGNFVISIYKVRDMDMNLDSYYNNLILSGSTVDAIKKYDTSFYRMEKDFSESGSSGFDATLYGYRGVGGSGPTVRQFIHSEVNRIGLNWYDMRHWYSDGVPAATDALLGIKYVLALRDLKLEKGYTPVVGNTTQTLYANLNCLSMAVLVDDPATQLTLGNNAFDNLNDIWKAMAGGNRDIFTPVDDVAYRLYNAAESFTISGDQLAEIASGLEDGSVSLYDDARFEMSATAERDGAVYRFDTSVPDSRNGSEEPSVKCVGYFKAGESIQDVEVLDGEYVTTREFIERCKGLVYARADADVLADYAQTLNAREIDFQADKSSCFTGSFTASSGQSILFTFPWDEGWTCAIDGKPVPIEKTWNLFMSVKVPEGHHTYEMRFFPAWMNYGLYLSGGALAGLIALLVVRAVRRRRTPAPAGPA